VADIVADIDMFFYHGELPVDRANEHDIALGVIQPKRSLFYNREDSAGINDYENYPNGFFLEVAMKYDIASWVARRNQLVGDGQNGTKDRRVATSQNVIDIQREGGEVNVMVLFVSFVDLQTPQKLTVPLGGGVV